MSGKILIVDDEDAVRFFTADALTRSGWQVVEADSGKVALDVLATTSCDVMLLDLRMPGTDGLAVMRQTKQHWPEVKIIIMTAYASIDSAIEAVRQGAFDYLQKPCSADDIVACANRALARKRADERQHELAQRSDAILVDSISKSDSKNVVRSGDLVINFGSHAVSLAGQPVSLTPTEYGLLEILAEEPGRPVSLQRLIQDGLGYDPYDVQAQETLRVHISRLRRKLDARYILTVRGGGYALAKIGPVN